MANPDNAVPRAHVLGSSPVPISQDPCHDVENVRDGEKNNTSTPSPAIGAVINQKDKRRQKKKQGTDTAIDLPTPPTPSDSDTEDTTTPISRKALRKQQRAVKRIPTPPTSDNESPNRNSPSKHKHTPHPSTMAARKTYPLLICSLGNPGASYAKTLHSAGHFVTGHIAATKQYQPFTKGLAGLISRPNSTTYAFGLFSGYKKMQDNSAPVEDDWTFWQSTSLMNISGPSVKKAWGEFSRAQRALGREPRLVVVHDELESGLGQVSIKNGSGSPRGHNGLKSVQGSLGGGVKWWRIGVGIGRPESREASVVSKYVLRKMTATEERALEKSCVGVVGALREIGEGRR